MSKPKNKPKRETRDVSGFTHIKLAIIGTIHLTQGDHDSLTIEANADFLPHITTIVKGDKLVIGSEPTKRNFRIKGSVGYYITMRQVDGITISGSGKLLAEHIQSDSLALHIPGHGKMLINDLQANQLNIKIPGHGKIDITGNAENMSLKINGMGRLDAEALQVKNVTVESNGLIRSTLWVTDNIDIKSMNGVGRLKYFGEPTIKRRNIRGLAKLTVLGMQKV